MTSAASTSSRQRTSLVRTSAPARVRPMTSPRVLVSPGPRRFGLVGIVTERIVPW